MYKKRSSKLGMVQEEMRRVGKVYREKEGCKCPYMYVCRKEYKCTVCGKSYAEDFAPPK